MYNPPDQKSARVKGDIYCILASYTNLFKFRPDNSSSFKTSDQSTFRSDTIETVPAYHPTPIRLLEGIVGDNEVKQTDDENSLQVSTKYSFEGKIKGTQFNDNDHKTKHRKCRENVSFPSSSSRVESYSEGKFTG